MDEQGIIPSLIAETERPFSVADSIELRRKLCGETPPYDPVAVLEAMRERYSLVDLCAGRDGSARGQWLATLRVDDKNGPYFFHELPDFTSAVRWLHQQAAEIDPEFAERWPVPE